MGNRSGCDLNIPYKTLQPDLERLADQVSLDMLRIEQWAKRLLQNCLPEGGGCEYAYSAREIILGDTSGRFGDNITTELHNCEGFSWVNDASCGGAVFVVPVAGVYHCTFGYQAIGGGSPVTGEYSVAQLGSTDGSRLQYGGAIDAGGTVAASVEISGDFHLTPTKRLDVIYDNPSWASGPSVIDAWFSAHMVHCECGG